MPVSDDQVYTYNRNQIIRAAARKLGVLKVGSQLSSAAMQDWGDCLNLMVKEWNAIGIHVWKETQATLFLQANQVAYEMGPNSPDHCTDSYVATAAAADTLSGSSTVQLYSTTGAASGYYIGITLNDGTLFWTTINGAPVGNVVTLTAPLPDSVSADNLVFYYQTKIQKPLRVPFARRFTFLGNITTPMIELSRSDYFDLPNKLNTGTVTQFFYDPKRANGVFYVWPAPIAPLNVVTITYYQSIFNFNTANDQPDLPQEWINCIVWNLAKEMGPEYSVNKERWDTVVAMAAEKMDLLTGWDREPQSVFFQIDTARMGSAG